MAIAASTTKQQDHLVIGLDPSLLQKTLADEAATDSFWLRDARFSHAAHAIESSSSAANDTKGGGKNILAAVKGAASSPAEALALVKGYFAEKLARMLMLAAGVVDPESGSIASYGIDSMIGAELRNWIFKEFRIDIPFQQLLAPTLMIAAFARQVVAAQGIKL